MKQDKNNFILGLAVGVAIISLAGMLIMSFGDKDEKAGQDNNAAQNNQQPTQAQAPAPSAPQAPANIDIEVKDTDWYKGKKDSDLTIIEFSDIQCSFCTRHHQTLKQIVADYPQVKWVYKHFPLDSIHPYARKAAEATECAGEQDNFWGYIDHLFENQSKINLDYLAAAAEEIGLDKDDFNQCLSSGKYSNKVNADYQDGLKAGVRGTPGNVINGQLVSGAVPYAQIQAMIEGGL